MLKSMFVLISESCVFTFVMIDSRFLIFSNHSLGIAAVSLDNSAIQLPLYKSFSRIIV